MIKVRCFSREVTMSKLGHIARAAMAGAITLLVTTALSAAPDAERPLIPTPKPHVAAQTKKPTALALAAGATAAKEEHRLILQVNTNDPAAMNLALNNATNVTQYYKKIG